MTSSAARVLDHHPSEHWDPRSVSRFGISRLGLGGPDDDPTNRWWRGGPVLDQMDTGHCGGFGAANEAGATPFRWKVDNAFGHAYYYEIKDRGLDPWDREDGTSSLAVAKLGVLRNLWDSYWWAQSTDDIWRGLGLGPMCFGLAWTEGMFTPDGQGFIHPTGAEVGGHFVTATGRAIDYRGRGPTVRIRQSWGRQHGVNGNVYIPLDELGDLLLGHVASQGEAFVPVGRDYPLPVAA